MKAVLLTTSDPLLRLVEPDVERDAPLGVHWMSGKAGRETLRLMGIPKQANKPSSLREERHRVTGFIENEDQLNWMIEYDNRIVGTIWVDLIPTDHLPAPSINIMIGDPAMRGKGIGIISMHAVIDFLVRSSDKRIYSRHLTDNLASQKLLHELGFRDVGKEYEDDDNLLWQNVAFKA